MAILVEHLYRPHPGTLGMVINQAKLYTYSGVVNVAYKTASSVEYCMACTSLK